jgi:hypothetical protein
LSHANNRAGNDQQESNDCKNAEQEHLVSNGHDTPPLTVDQFVLLILLIFMMPLWFEWYRHIGTILDRGKQRQDVD